MGTHIIGLWINYAYAWKNEVLCYGYFVSKYSLLKYCLTGFIYGKCAYPIYLGNMLLSQKEGNGYISVAEKLK